MGSFFNPVDDKYHYDPDRHIPDLSGKVIIVTGGNNGIGKATVMQLAKHNPNRIYLTARSRAKYVDAMVSVREAAPNARVEFLELDLASFASIKKAADHVIESNDRLDILVNNAGIMGLPPALTQDGYEVHFGTNHMGHALLTKLLLPLLLKSAEHSDVRIVNVSSEGHKLAPTGTFLPDKVTTPMSEFHSYVAYGQSKIANILHARELAKRYPQILSTSVHPGRVATPILDQMFTKRSFTAYLQKFYDAIAGMLTPEMGAFTSLWCSTWKKEDVQNGGYYTPIGKLSPGDKRSQDMEVSQKLWEWQEDEFRKHGYA
ncbi:hypothetical protein A1O1_05061 [Capronia coronata CBS 617.96]|uniref:Oxidoreductase n=1 Tax=Capronia coronata CBS 617.96 TaxID=1182541 RepID=W9Y6H4_9EURO|nr:uncharacterized protein A1O1_05061 [Capronia coronata CBS 617.96]EXJ88133.1 hypothetical protein A1O1_05061 [Capronia coronata CBS 617.96]